MCLQKPFCIVDMQKGDSAKTFLSGLLANKVLNSKGFHEGLKFAFEAVPVKIRWDMVKKDFHIGSTIKRSSFQNGIRQGRRC